MTDPVISPDGKSMWTGEEWIPVTTDSNNTLVSLHDSVVTGDINTEINYATTINKKIINENKGAITIKEINLHERLINYFLGFVSIAIGLTMNFWLELAYGGEVEWDIDNFWKFCCGLQLLLVGFGAYMIIQTAENRRQFKSHNQ